MRFLERFERNNLCQKCIRLPLPRNSREKKALAGKFTAFTVLFNARAPTWVKTLVTALLFSKKNKDRRGPIERTTNDGCATRQKRIFLLQRFVSSSTRILFSRMHRSESFTLFIVVSSLRCAVLYNLYFSFFKCLETPLGDFMLKFYEDPSNDRENAGEF